MRILITSLLIVITFSSCKELINLLWVATPVNHNAELMLPTDDANSVEITDYSGAITMILLDNNKIYFYQGVDPLNGKLILFKDVRNLLKKTKNATSADKFVVLIKPSEKATYKNTIDILDEMSINEIKRYVMQDINTEEKRIIEGLK